MPRCPDPVPLWLLVAAIVGKGGVHLLDQKPTGVACVLTCAAALLVTLDNCYRSQSALSRRRVLQMSALSTFGEGVRISRYGK